MATYSIRKDGRGDFTTIGAFVQAAERGDEGRIDDSEVYNESVTITKSDIRIFAGPGQQPTWMWYGTCAILASGVTGFRLEGASPDLPMIIAPRSGYYGVYGSGANGAITLRYLRCTQGWSLLSLAGTQPGPQTVQHCTADGCVVLLDGDQYQDLQCANCRVTGQSQSLFAINTLGGIIERCYVTGVRIGGPSASQMSYVGNPIIRNIHFRNTLGGTLAALEIWSDVVTVSECTLIRSDKTELGLVATIPAWALSRPVFYNCAVKGFGTAYYSTYSGASAVTSHCDAWDFGTAGWGGQAVQQPTDRIIDPKFLDETTGQIGADSPLVDSGTATTGTPDDIRGAVRPSGAGYDRGCWELGLFVMRARYDREQGIRVDFSGPVKQVSALAEDDALNPANWDIQRSDGLRLPYLLGIETISSESVRLRLAGPGATIFDGLGIAASTNIASADGQSHVEPGGTEAQCVGAVEPPRSADAVTRVIGIRDVRADPQTGQYVTTDAGDYALASSEETVRALVYRALSTVAGEWAHLPQYGGLGRGLYAPARTADLQRLVSVGRSAILGIPGVQEAHVEASVSGQGALLVRATVRVANLGTIVVGYEREV